MKGAIFALLLLVSVVGCVRVISSAERPEKKGYFTFKNFSLRSHKDFTLCLKLKSAKFGLTDEGFYQNIIYQGNKCLLGVVTNQYCEHLEEGCTKNQKENNSNVDWEHGKSYGYHQYLGVWEYFNVWKPTTLASCNQDGSLSGEVIHGTWNQRFLSKWIAWSLLSTLCVNIHMCA